MYPVAAVRAWQTRAVSASAILVLSVLSVLSVIPPMTQLNTPYPSTTYLTSFLRSRGVDELQEDLALALVLALLSADGLHRRRCTSSRL
jgi:hypothetical protein